MSHTVPIEAHHVKKGGHIMLKGFPCKIIEVKTSKTGKHGHAKCNITGVDVLTKRKYNEVHPGHIILGEVQPTKQEYEVGDFDTQEKVLDIMDENGENSKYYLDETAEMDAEFIRTWEQMVEDGKDIVWMVTTVTAPVGVNPDSMKLTTVIESFKPDTTTPE
jgi:translation initiation factor 5A